METIETSWGIRSSVSRTPDHFPVVVIPACQHWDRIEAKARSSHNSRQIDNQTTDPTASIDSILAGLQDPLPSALWI